MWKALGFTLSSCKVDPFANGWRCCGSKSGGIVRLQRQTRSAQIDLHRTRNKTDETDAVYIAKVRDRGLRNIGMTLSADRFSPAYGCGRSHPMPHINLWAWKPSTFTQCDWLCRVLDSASSRWEEETKKKQKKTGTTCLPAVLICHGPYSSSRTRTGLLR